MIQKTVKVGDKEVTFRSSATIPRLYRMKFRRDITPDIFNPVRIGSLLESTPMRGFRQLTPSAATASNRWSRTPSLGKLISS